MFVDHYTSYTWLYLLKHKSDVFPIFVQFKSMVKTQFFAKIQTFRSDGGGEFTSTAFKSFLANNGIVHQISCPYTPQQNSLVERKYRHII